MDYNGEGDFGLYARQYNRRSGPRENGPVFVSLSKTGEISFSTAAMKIIGRGSVRMYINRDRTAIIIEKMPEKDRTTLTISMLNGNGNGSLSAAGFIDKHELGHYAGMRYQLLPLPSPNQFIIPLASPVGKMLRGRPSGRE